VILAERTLIYVAARIYPAGDVLASDHCTACLQVMRDFVGGRAIKCLRVQEVTLHAHGRRSRKLPACRLEVAAIQFLCSAISPVLRCGLRSRWFKPASWQLAATSPTAR
jgi:hypothetical protein